MEFGSNGAARRRQLFTQGINDERGENEETAAAEMMVFIITMILSFLLQLLQAIPSIHLHSYAA